METPDVGDTVRVDFTIKVLGKLTDPTTLECIVDPPLGASFEVAETRVDVGTYYMLIPIDESGTWHYRITGTGDAPGSEERSFRVRRQLVPEP